LAKGNIYLEEPVSWGTVLKGKMSRGEVVGKTGHWEEDT